MEQLYHDVNLARTQVVEMDENGNEVAIDPKLLPDTVKANKSL